MGPISTSGTKKCTHRVQSLTGPAIGHAYRCLVCGELAVVETITHHVCGNGTRMAFSTGRTPILETHGGGNG
jgi:hypothetical protein